MEPFYLAARKSKLNEAAASKETVQGLLCEPGYSVEVKSNFDKCDVLVNDAKYAHSTLLKLLPVEEKEKHEIWFKAKLQSVKDFSQSVTDYLKCAREDVENADDKITPLDSISNVNSATSSLENCSTKSCSSRGLSKSNRSCKSSIAIARV